MTHGLLGAATVALPLPLPLRRALAREQDRTSLRAAIVAAVLAAELPDLDYLVPASDAVLHTLQAHRGVSHSLLAAPLVALVAAAIAKLLFREARFVVLYGRALVAVPLAHLLPDLWTGWGTRLLLPFSDRRWALDWTMVVDPWFTLPLLTAAIGAGVRRTAFRRTMMWGLAVSGAYLGLRVILASHLTEVTRRAYPHAQTLHVFPSPLAITRWRYVARVGEDYVAGSVALLHPPEQQARVPTSRDSAIAAERLSQAPTVREALAWARFPIVSVGAPNAAGERQLEIADLRYHLRGVPTLKFVLTVAADSRVTRARLERGGSPRELLRRWLGRSHAAQ